MGLGAPCACLCAQRSCQVRRGGAGGRRTPGRARPRTSGRAVHRRLRRPQRDAARGPMRDSVRQGASSSGRSGRVEHGSPASMGGWRGMATTSPYTRGSGAAQCMPRPSHKRARCPAPALCPPATRRAARGPSPHTAQPPPSWPVPPHTRGFRPRARSAPPRLRLLPTAPLRPRRQRADARAALRRHLGYLVHPLVGRRARALHAGQARRQGVQERLQRRRRVQSRHWRLPVPHRCAYRPWSGCSSCPKGPPSSC